MATGRYETAATPEALAALLTADLRAATNDQHLGVAVVASSPPGSGDGVPEVPPQSRTDRDRRRARRTLA